MDLLIDKGGGSYRLSELGIVVKDVKATGPKLNPTRNNVNFRNGKIYYGSVYEEKNITVTGSYYAVDEYDDQLIQDRINSLIMTSEPFYVSKMYSVQGLYEFERPGETTNPDFTNFANQRAYHYRWRVIASDNVDYDFQGKSGAGLLTNITISLTTADIPYGISQPQDIDLTGQSYLSYKGTAVCSQLEWPFSINMVANSAQGSGFSLTIGNQQFTYAGAAIKQNDVFELKGDSFLLNGLNINDKTNIQYFSIGPSSTGVIPISTDFKGTIVIKNMVNMYL
ncbi:phage tail domain-containing protein [Latilactobacillus fragifolii]|uniref:phage tail domain-containing protein n=1 Tax=Latilactobacillus fragifolii TaxID=2814244 RepID=UPI001ABA1C5F|nr:phage tail domain-containing protein [Latilactobacillus fragifolii]